MGLHALGLVEPVLGEQRPDLLSDDGPGPRGEGNVPVILRRREEAVPDTVLLPQPGSVGNGLVQPLDRDAESLDILVVGARDPLVDPRGPGEVVLGLEVGESEAAAQGEVDHRQ